MLDVLLWVQVLEIWGQWLVKLGVSLARLNLKVENYSWELVVDYFVLCG